MTIPPGLSDMDIGEVIKASVDAMLRDGLKTMSKDDLVNTIKLLQEELARRE